MDSKSPPGRWALRIGTIVVGIVWLCAALPTAVQAEVTLDGLFSRNAVLQQGMPVTIFGKADDGEQVVVAIQNRQATTVAKDGRWEVTLEPLEAGGPFDLRLGGATTLTVPEVYVGEVWVCAGQANMQWNVFNSRGKATAMIAPENRSLHFYTVEREASAEPRLENEPTWFGANAATIANFSAVGYYFGREIQSARKVPVGLINCCHYLSNAEAWADRDSLAADPELKRIIDDVLPDRTDVLTPGTLYDGMVSPISRFTVRGIIWYQGENNVERADEYQRLFSTVIADWRRAWKQPEMPFLFVQIAPYKPLIGSAESKLAALREAQLKTWLATPGTAMVVTTDHGSAQTLTPDHKEPVGDRLALAARALAYGESVEYSGPVYKGHKVIKSTIVIDFDHLGGGLQAGPGKTESGTSLSGIRKAVLPASTTKDAASKDKAPKLTGFTIAGEDGKFVPAEAVIEGETVVVTAEGLEKPKAVRYGWADFPVCNLFNKEGLPASPFRTDAPAEKPAEQK